MAAKPWLRFVFLPFFLVVIAVGDLEAADYQIVTEEWAPYNYEDGGKLTGISTDVVNAIMDLTQVRYKIQLLPSMRATSTLNREPRTILYSLFRTKERESKYKWVGPILVESISPYRLKTPAPLWKTWDELRALPQVTTRYAGLVPSLLQAQGFTNLDTSAKESEQLYKLLFSRRAEVIVGDTDLGVRYYLRKLGLDYGALEKIPVEVFRSELYIVFSPDSEDAVVDAWRAALETLKTTGALKKILAKYE
jgi:polar amino acid transport system substrate-binding protein